MTPRLPDSVALVIDKLERAGFEAYIVGGSVRDMLMKAEPHDYDVATSALPSETEALFGDRRVIETGLKHGTVTVVVEHMHIEITTFRTEGAYSDFRRPDSVEFTRSVEKDLARRDFTVNAMAYSPRTGLIDPFGGQADISRRTVRAVGEPDDRFSEDALRLLRALRFSSALEFGIEERTASSLRANAKLLTYVSRERIFAELLKLLMGRGARRVLTEYIEPLGVVLPELLPMRGFEQRNPWHIYDLLEHTARVVEAVPPVPALKLAALLHDSGKPRCFSLDKNGTGHFYGHPAVSAELADAALSRLKAENSLRALAVRLIRAHDDPIAEDDRAVRRALMKLTPEVFFPLVELKRADSLAQNPKRALPASHFDALRSTAKRIIAEGECFSLASLAINGRDLISLGVQPGKQMGELLNELLMAVTDGVLSNDRAALTEYVKAKIKQ